MADNTTSETDNEETPGNQHCPKINIQLLPYKCFYFLFFSAVGSLFPYLAIFYKQLWLSAQQTGILIGIRPLLQLVSCSVWGIIADKTDKSKLIFLISLVAWLSSNFALSLVKHPINLGPCRDNGTLTMIGNVLHLTMATPSSNTKSNRNTSDVTIIHDKSKQMYRKQFNKKDLKKSKRSSLVAVIQNKTSLKQDTPFERNIIYKMMVTLQNEKNERRFDELNALGHSPWSLRAISKFKVEEKSATSYHEDDRVFSLLLIITVVGTLVAAPAIPFADTATLQVLGDNKDFYGKQRQWGSLGWGLSSFAVGSLVSTLQEKSNCNVPSHVNYMPCFYAFSILIIIAFVPALFFHFEDRHTTGVNVTERLRTLLTLDCALFLSTILLFGCSWGLLQTFLLWHLQDLGGTQFLFSIVAAVQCLSEVVSYYCAGHVIKLLGHYRVLYVALLFSSLRFVLYGLIKNPWFVLPIEFFHGVSTTLVWSIAVSFIGLNSGVATTLQGILSGVHWGLGLGGGAILGGLLVSVIGSQNTFIVFGIIPLINLILLMTIRNLTCCLAQSEEARSLLGSTNDEDYESIAMQRTAASAAEHFP